MSSPNVPHRVRRARVDAIYGAFNSTVLALFAVSILYPLIYIVSSSFSDPAAVLAGKVWLLPVRPSLVAYKELFEYPPVWRGYLNSLIYASVGAVVSVTLTLLAAYPVSRRKFRGRNLYMALFVFTLIFDGGMIPTYILVRSLGILNTRLAMILPSAVAAWNVIITRTYFQVSIPDELLEAAHIDGCGDFRFFREVVLPLSGAIIAVNGLFYAVGKWNAFFEAYIYLNKQRLFPLQLILREILIANSMTSSLFAVSASSEAARQAMRELLKFALIVVASAPVLAIYPFVQKYFVRGMLIGSIKG